MFLSYLAGARYVHPAVSVLVVARPNSEVRVGLMNYPVHYVRFSLVIFYTIFSKS